MNRLLTVRSQTVGLAAAFLILTIVSTGHAAQAQNEQLAGLIFFLFIVALAFPISALTMLYAAVAPSVTERAADQIGDRRRVGFWLGLIILGVTSVVCSGLLSLGGVFVLVFFLVLTAMSLAWLVGFSGVAHWVGRAVLSGPEVSTALATGCGALTLTLCSCLPFIGWIIGFYVTCLSLGIFPYAWFSSPRIADGDSFPPLRADDIDIVRSR